MKQIIKRLWLGLCMTACLFSMSAYAAEAGPMAPVGPTETKAFLEESLPFHLTVIAQMTDEEIASEIAVAEQKGDKVGPEILGAWKLAKAEVGAPTMAAAADGSPVVEVVSVSVVEVHGGYSGTVKAKFEKRELEYKVNFDEQANITSASFTPVYTTGERMVKASLNTAMGMGTVFMVLIFIIFIISLFKYINVFQNRAASQPTVASAPAIVPAVSAQPAAAEDDLVDDLELVAVITAAIAASLNTSTDGLIVRSIRRASNANWKRA